MRFLVVSLMVAGCATASTERRQAERVVLKALESPDPRERTQATRLVVEVADPVLDPLLALRLGDEDPRVRAVAAAALARQIEPARPVLYAALAGEDVEATVLALDGVAALENGAELAAKLCEDEDERVRARAVWALARLDKKRAREVVARLVADPRPGVRAEALRALGGDAPRALVEKAMNDPALAVRLAALAHLARESDDRPLLAAAAGRGAAGAARARVARHRRESDERSARRAARGRHERRRRAGCAGRRAGGAALARSRSRGAPGRRARARRRRRLPRKSAPRALGGARHRARARRRRRAFAPGRRARPPDAGKGGARERS